MTNNTQYTTNCTYLHPTLTGVIQTCLLYIVLIINTITLKLPLGLPKNNNYTKPLIAFRNLITELQVYAQYSIKMR